MSEQSNLNNQVMNTNMRYNTSTIIEKRLNTKEILSNIESYLKGTQQFAIEEDDQIRIKEVQIGHKKANDDGIQSIMSFVSSIFNPQTVQGNFPADGNGLSTMYDNYIEEVNIDLLKMLIINSENWEISDEDIEAITDYLMKLIIPFMTRLIDNEERNSYKDTIKTSENNIVNSGKSGFSLFGGN